MPSKPKPICFVSDPDAERPGPGYRRLTADLPVFEETATITLDVPDARVGLADIMPAAWAISEHLTERAVARVHARGETIPCRKGCKACCRSFFVACSPPEVFRMLDDIRALRPPETQRHLLALTASADLYAKSGVVQAAAAMDISHDQRAATHANLVAAYWRKTSFDCPLLRDDACSLYASRPATCREFLVTSPPELCVTYEQIRVTLPFSMVMALAIWAGQVEQLPPRLVPLPNILVWSANKTTRATRTWRAPAIAQTFLDVLTDRAIAEAAAESAPA
jgi:Fe-S-cluster containining protein